MKVLIAKQNIEKTYSGATRTVYEQIKLFQSKGYDVHIIGEQINKADLLATGAVIHSIIRWPWLKKYKRRLSFSNQVLKLTKKLRPDLVIGHGDLQEQDIFVLHNCVHLAEEKINDKKLSSTHEMYQTHTPILENRKFKRVIANSAMMKKDLIKRFAINEDVIDIVYPSIDPLAFESYKNKNTEKIRKSILTNNEEIIVGLITSGNFKKRGLLEFLKAIEKLPRSIAKKTRFIYVGKDKLNTEMQECLSKHIYRDQILHYPITQNINDLFNAIDIFVLPAKIEEFGRVVAEAMACQLPVITTKWVGAAELLDGKSKEFILNGHQDKNLTSYIQELIQNKELREELGTLNKKSIQKITQENIFKQYDKLLKSLGF